MHRELAEGVNSGLDDHLMADDLNGANPFSRPPGDASGVAASPVAPCAAAERRARQTLRRLKGMAAVETDSVDECTVDLLSRQSRQVLDLLEQEWLAFKPGWPTASGCAALIERIERRLGLARQDF